VRMNPAALIRRQSSSWGYAMNVRVVPQLLGPGMQDAEEANTGAEVLGIGGDGLQGCGSGAKQQVVEEFLILAGQGVKFGRDGEDQMDVSRGQELLAARVEPAPLGMGLTLGAVAITARVEGDHAMPTLGAFIQVATQGGGTAVWNGPQHLELLCGKPVTMLLDEIDPRQADHIGHLPPWGLH